MVRRESQESGFSGMQGVGWVVGFGRCSWVRLIGYGRDRTPQRGRSLVVPRAPVRMHLGGAQLSGHILESGAGHCSPVCWRAIAPLMKPWCAEEEVPTAANLNLYRGLHSRVGWHCDDEPLFGWTGCSKLIVSVNMWSLVYFKWKAKSCPDGDVSSCYLGHGDILVMDGQCQDEFLHCTNPGLERERINVTFRWIRQHTASCPLRAGVVCCLPTCANGSSAAVTGGVGSGTFLGTLGAPCSLCYEVGGSWHFLSVLGAPWGPVCMGDAGSAGAFPHVYRTRVTEVCLSLETPIGRRYAWALFA